MDSTLEPAITHQNGFLANFDSQFHVTLSKAIEISKVSIRSVETSLHTNTLPSHEQRLKSIEDVCKRIANAEKQFETLFSSFDLKSGVTDNFSEAVEQAINWIIASQSVESISHLWLELGLLTRDFLNQEYLGSSVIPSKHDPMPQILKMAATKKQEAQDKARLARMAFDRIASSYPNLKKTEIIKRMAAKKGRPFGSERAIFGYLKSK